MVAIYFSKFSNSDALAIKTIFTSVHLALIIFTARRYTRKRGLCCRRGVRPSVCLLSFTFVYCIQMAERYMYRQASFFAR